MHACTAAHTCRHAHTSKHMYTNTHAYTIHPLHDTHAYAMHSLHDNVKGTGKWQYSAININEGAQKEALKPALKTLHKFRYIP